MVYSMVSLIELVLLYYPNLVQIKGVFLFSDNKLQVLRNLAANCSALRYFESHVYVHARGWIIGAFGQANIHCALPCHHSNALTTRRTARTYVLEFSTQSYKSPECVETRWLGANCVMARKYVDSLSRLFRQTNALDFCFLISCQREFSSSYNFSLIG